MSSLRTDDGGPPMAERLRIFGDLDSLGRRATHTAEIVRCLQVTAQRFAGERRTRLRLGEVDPDCKACGGRLAVCPLFRSLNWRLCPHAP